MANPSPPYKNYRVTLSKKSQKFLKQLPLKQRTFFIDKLDELVAGFPVDLKKLKGYKYFYRIRVGDYRIVFEPDTKKKTIYIHCIAHRKDAYKPISLLKTTFH